jgi:hypothetical protein
VGGDERKRIEKHHLTRTDLRIAVLSKALIGHGDEGTYIVHELNRARVGDPGRRTVEVLQTELVEHDADDVYSHITALLWREHIERIGHHCGRRRPGNGGGVERGIRERACSEGPPESARTWK